MPVGDPIWVVDSTVLSKKSDRAIDIFGQVIYGPVYSVLVDYTLFHVSGEGKHHSIPAPAIVLVV